MFISINEKSGFFCLRCYVIALFLCLTIIPLFSDVTSDGTTGTIINPVPFVGAGTYAITGGTIQDGTALFHSFDEFSIDQDQIAHFQNGIGIENIFSRITCGNQSWIDGEIEVDNTANLYLMNPSGFLFGSNSSLSIPGSFYITTADYLSFDDGGIFYADSGETSILSSDSVSAFGFTNPSPSGVEITGGLEVSAEKELAIIAGDIYLYADTVSGSLYAPYGYISVISVASEGVWNLTDLSSFSSLGDISITDSSWISLEDAGYGGQIYIRGNNFVIDCSNVDATTNSNDGYGNSIDIALTGKLTIQNEGGILNGTTDAGNSDEIKITAAEMELTSGGYIIQKTVDDGDCGEINLSVNGKLDINDAGDDPSGIYCFIGSDAQGSGNSMNINASEIALSIGGVISSVTNGSGDAGEIILTTDKLIMNTGSYIENSNWEDTINPLKTGSSGDLTINAGSLIMSGDSYIDNSSYTSGNIGETSIIVSGDIKLNNSKIYSNVAGAGNGGDLFIRCNSMLLENGGIIDFSIYGSGQCAELNIKAEKEILIDGFYDLQSGIYNDLEAGNSKPGNFVKIETPKLYLNNGGIVSCRTYTNQHGSELQMNVNELLSISGYAIEDGTYYSSAIFSGTTDEGNGGDIAISTGKLVLKSGGQIYGSSWGDGAGSDISINATESVNISGSYYGIDAEDFSEGYFDIGSRISSGSRESGPGGYIEITSPELKISDLGEIECGTWGDANVTGEIKLNIDNLEITSSGYVNTATWGSGAGGDIILNVGKLYIGSWGAIDSSGAEGEGGDISITAREAVILDSAYIEAGSYDSGDAGDISIKSPLVTFDNESYISAETLDSGSGGDVTIDAEKIVISGNAVISAKSEGEGTAGSITLNASDRIEMNDSKISVLSEEEDGGDIVINTNYWLKLINSKITAEVKGGEGDGGNIKIDPIYVILINSQIIANAYGGSGGNITIVANLFLKDILSTITASSKLGIDGDVEITAPEVDISGSLKSLPSEIMTATSLLPKRCTARKDDEKSSFIISGKKGFPVEPAMLLQFP